MFEIDHSGFKRLIIEVVVLLRYYQSFPVRVCTVRVHADHSCELVNTQSSLLRDGCRFFSTGPTNRY